MESRAGASRSTLLAFGGPAFWRTWEEIGYSLVVGEGDQIIFRIGHFGDFLNP